MQLAVAGLNRQIVTSDVGLTADKMDALWPRLPEITLASTAGKQIRRPHKANAQSFIRASLR